MKTPKVEKLPSGNYFCRLRLNGQSIPITAPSRAECLKIAELTKSQYRAGAGTIKRLPKDVTLSEAVSTYINRYKKTLSPSTVRGYNVYKRTRFVEYMNVPLGEIDFQEMIDDELKTGISPKTIRNAWGLIHAAIKDLGIRICRPCAKPPVITGTLRWSLAFYWRFYSVLSLLYCAVLMPKSAPRSVQTTADVFAISSA